jgi:hypothetical protein
MSYQCGKLIALHLKSLQHPTLSARWWNLNIWLYTQTFRHNSVNGKHKLHIIPFPSLFSPCVCAPTFSTLAYFVRIDWNVKSEFGFEMKMNKYVHTLLHKRHVLGRSWIDPIIRTILTTIIAFIWWYFLIETSHFRFWCYISKVDVKWKLQNQEFPIVCEFTLAFWKGCRFSISLVARLLL